MRRRRSRLPVVDAAAAVPHLAKTGGAIVNVSSTLARKPAAGFAGFADYAASKAALEQLTRCWALELAAKGVRVNAVAAGPVETAFLRERMGLSEEAAAAVEAGERAAIPLGRRGEPDDVAAWIVALAAPSAAWVTGQVLGVDGGFSLVRWSRSPRPGHVVRPRPRRTVAEGRIDLMKIVVIGGSGLIGSKVVSRLRAAAHEVVAASPSTGVNALTGEGLSEALAGAQVVVDLTNSPSFEPQAVLDFFRTSGRNLAAAERAAGVGHHVALSIVGTERTPDNGYFRAKVAQEETIKGTGVPYTIVRATQFMEFLGAIADASLSDGVVRLPTGQFQPIAAEDVAAFVAEAALAAPRNGTFDVAGPERASFDAFVGRYLAATGDRRPVVADPAARYFGWTVEELSLVPLGEARLGRIGFDEWFQSRPRG